MTRTDEAAERDHRRSQRGAPGNGWAGSGMGLQGRPVHCSAMQCRTRLDYAGLGWSRGPRLASSGGMVNTGTYTALNYIEVQGMSLLRCAVMATEWLGGSR